MTQEYETRCKRPSLLFGFSITFKFCSSKFQPIPSNSISPDKGIYRTVGRAHYIAADRNTKFNRYFGVPVVVITAVVGTTIFGTLNENPDPNWRIATGLFLLTGTVLSSLQTTLGFAQTAEKHKAAAEAYKAVRRKFTLFQLKYAEAPPNHRQDAFIDLEKIVENLAELPKEFPTVPDRCFKKAQREHQK